MNKPNNNVRKIFFPHNDTALFIYDGYVEEFTAAHKNANKIVHEMGGDVLGGDVVGYLEEDFNAIYVKNYSKLSDVQVDAILRPIFTMPFVA